MPSSVMQIVVRQQYLMSFTGLNQRVGNWSGVAFDIELNVPMILAINMVDVARKWRCTKFMACQLLGINVFPVIGSKRCWYK
ncbi:hypothetical protein ACP8HZ_10380 [Francisella noatunensis]